MVSCTVPLASHIRGSFCKFRTLLARQECRRTRPSTRSNNMPLRNQSQVRSLTPPADFPDIVILRLVKSTIVGVWMTVQGYHRRRPLRGPHSQSRIIRILFLLRRQWCYLGGRVTVPLGAASLINRLRTGEGALNRTRVHMLNMIIEDKLIEID